MTHDSNTIYGKIMALLRKQYLTNARLNEMAEKILAEFVVIPRADLPEVEDRGGARLLVAEYTYSRTADPRALRDEAIRRLAIAEYLEPRDSEAAVAEERRNKRRDELAREHGSEGVKWENVTLTSQSLIDYIVATEEEPAK